MDDSHRAEVRKRVYSFFFEDYKLIPQNPTAQTDAIMAILDSERERWIGEVKAALPEKRPGIQEYKDTDGEPYHTCLHCGGYDECDCEGFNEALDAVSKVLDGLEQS